MSSFFHKKNPKPAGTGPVKKTGSLSTRAKKFMASKAADSSAGRRTIVKFFGVEGEEIVKALTTAVEVVEGQVQAKQMMVDVLKLAGKLGILMSNATVKEGDFEGAEKAVFEVASGMIDGIECGTGPGLDKHVSRVRDNLVKVGDEVYGVVRPYMQDKNSRKLLDVVGRLSGDGYLRALMMGKELEGPREVLRDNIKGFMESNAGMRKMNEFLKGEQMRRRAKLRHLLLNPSFQGYMKDPEIRSRVMEWVVGEGNPCLYQVEFFVAVGKYREVDNVKLRKTRGEGVYYKFLAEGVERRVLGDGEMGEEMKELDNRLTNGAFSRDIFDPFLVPITSNLSSLFLGTGINKHSFLSSPQGVRMEEELRDLEKRLEVGGRGRRISKLSEGFWEDGEGDDDEDEVGEKMEGLKVERDE